MSFRTRFSGEESAVHMGRRDAEDGLDEDVHTSEDARFGPFREKAMLQFQKEVCAKLTSAGVLESGWDGEP
jgi:hypothetical protein